MDFSPRFDQSLLCPWQASSDAFDRINRKDRGCALVVRMEMRPVMRRPRLDEHANHDAEEPRQLGH